MGTGYTRADTANNIADGNIINASDLDSEYDAIQSAFDASTGHTHDGTTGEGAPIETIGPTQDVVATASVLRPKTDNTVDLGTTTLEYKDLFLDGTAHIDTLDVDENASITGTLGVTGTTTLGTANITTGTITTADINGGNIDGTIIGATTAAAITGTTITGTSFVTSGDMTFGDNDKAVFGAGSDLQIYHSGAASFITENGTGDLNIQGNNLVLEDPSGNNYLFATSGGAVSLFHNASTKLATTNTGVDITGNTESDTVTIGVSSVAGSEKLRVNGTVLTLGGSEATPAIGIGDVNTGVYAPTAGKLGWTINGTQRLFLDSTGVDITGTLTSDGLTVEGASAGLANFYRASANANFGAITFKDTTNTTTNAQIGWNANELRLDGTNTIRQVTGGLSRMLIASNGDISFYEDTGTTAKFFWDASAEGLAIGDGGSGIEGMLDLQKTDNTVYTSSSRGNGFLQITNASTTSGVFSGIELIATGTGSAGAAEILCIDTGSGSGDLAFTTRNGGTWSEKMRIDSSGDVIVKSGNKLQLNRDDDTRSMKIFTDNNAGTIQTTDDPIIIDAASGRIRFDIASSEKMRIDSSGNVGIGTSSPNYALDVEDSGGGFIKASFVSTGSTHSSIVFDNTGSSANSVRVGSQNNDFYVRTSGTERMRIDSSGNLLIAGTGTPTSSVGNLVLYNGTAPTGNATDGVILYAEDVSSSSELKVRDEAGNVTTLSPHNFDLIPEGPSEDMAWSYYSERDGKRINVDMLKAVRLLEQLTGEKLVHIV